MLLISQLLQEDAEQLGPPRLFQLALRELPVGMRMYFTGPLRERVDAIAADSDAVSTAVT